MPHKKKMPMSEKKGAYSKATMEKHYPTKKKAGKKKASKKKMKGY